MTPNQALEPKMSELLFKALDFLLVGLLEKKRQRKALSGQLAALKRHISNVSAVNNYPVELARLSVPA